MSNFTYSDALYHHGIEGQKWHVRRFQNEDGSLTPAGKERYLSSNKKSSKTTREKQKATKALIDDAKSMISSDKSKLSNYASMDDTEFSVFLEEITGDNSDDYSKEEIAEMHAEFNKSMKITKKDADKATDDMYDKLADDVIYGKYGNGEERKKKLGRVYDEVQKRVNKKLSHSNFTYSDELYHYGTPGMKWGHRRYQYLDGKLTPEGYEHYGKKPRELREEASKFRTKSAKWDRASTRLLFRKNRTKAERKMAKYNLKAAKLEEKASRIEKDEAEALETAKELNRKYANELAVAREIETDDSYRKDEIGTSTEGIKNSATLRRMAEDFNKKYSKDLPTMRKALSMEREFNSNAELRRKYAEQEVEKEGIAKRGDSNFAAAVDERAWESESLFKDYYLKDPNNKAAAKAYADGTKISRKYYKDARDMTDNMVRSLTDFGIIDSDESQKTALLVNSLLTGSDEILKRIR